MIKKQHVPCIHFTTVLNNSHCIIQSQFIYAALEMGINRS